jgi:hypothetical protein
LIRPNSGRTQMHMRIENGRLRAMKKATRAHSKKPAAHLMWPADKSRVERSRPSHIQTAAMHQPRKVCRAL